MRIDLKACGDTSRSIYAEQADYLFNAIMKKSGMLSREESEALSNALPLDENRPDRHSDLIKTYDMIDEFNNKEDK